MIIYKVVQGDLVTNSNKAVNAFTRKRFNFNGGEIKLIPRNRQTEVAINFEKFLE